MQISKATIIFLVIFTLLSISLTVGATVYTYFNYSDQSSSVILDEKLKGDIAKETSKSADNSSLQVNTFSGNVTALTDTYSTNALKVKEIVYKNGTPASDEYSEKIIIKYPEISELSDSNIRTNINNLIKDKVFSLYTEDELNDTNIKHIDITSEVVANFSDVISIKIESKKEYVSGETIKDFTGLNYKLENGQEIRFKNLFIPGASIKNILRHSAYNSLAWTYKNDENITNMNNIDYHKLDDMVYNTLNAYNRNDSPEFYFTEKEIVVKLNGKEVRIEMMDCSEQIAIYKVYKSNNNLYASTTNASSIPIYTDRNEYADMDFYMQIDDNLIIDIILDTSSLDKSSANISSSLEDYKAKLNEKINTLKDDAKKDKDEYVFYISRITPKVESEQNKLIFDENTYRYTAYSKTQFDVYIKSPILSEKRKLWVTNKKTKFDLNNQSIKIKNLSEKVEYDTKTGKPWGEEIPENTEENNVSGDNVQNNSTVNNNSNNEPNSYVNNNEVVNNTNTNNEVVEEPENEVEEGNIDAVITY